MQPADLLRDIGRIIQVEFDGSRQIGYLTRLQADRIYLSFWNQQIEAQRRWWIRRLSLFSKIGIKNISTAEKISPIELSLETIGSLKIGTPLQFNFFHSAGVGYVAGITPEGLKIDSYDPIIEAQKGFFSRRGYAVNCSLDALLPNYKRQIYAVKKVE